MQDMKRRARILTIGEVLDMDWENGTRRLASMVNNNMLHSQLQYALYGASARVFLGPDGMHTHEVLNTTVLAVSVGLWGLGTLVAAAYSISRYFQLPAVSLV
jgi:hypothetical protein